MMLLSLRAIAILGCCAHIFATAADKVVTRRDESDNVPQPSPRRVRSNSLPAPTLNADKHIPSAERFLGPTGPHEHWPTTPTRATGDPRFRRFGQRANDSFHGECDLVLFRSQSFNKDEGIELHVRTKIDSFYSYVEAAAFRVGKHIVEIDREQFFIDDVKYTTDDLPLTFGGQAQYKINLTAKKKSSFAIRVDLVEIAVDFKFYRHLATVEIDGDETFPMDTIGLFGKYPTGEMVGREGQIFTKFIDYAFEWQVHPDDDKLFQKDRAPQLPFERCRLPTQARPMARRLADTGLHEQAIKACDHVEIPSDYELCIEDVLLTRDIGVGAEVW